MEVSDCMEPVSRSLEGELRRQVEHLVARIRPILEKIDKATLAHQCNGILDEIAETSITYIGIGDNSETNVVATTVSSEDI